MRALGEHLIVRLPDPREKSEGGILFTDLSKQDWTYGRVVSVGERVPRNGPDQLRAVEVGDIVAFDKLGQRPLDLDETRKGSGLVIIHHEMLFTEMAELELTERKLPIPA